MKLQVSGILFLFLVVLSSESFADPKSVRWTGKEDKNSELTHVLAILKSKTGFDLSPTQFMLVENRKLATSHYVFLAQTAAGVPIRGQSLRIWTSLSNSETIQIEARVDQAPSNLDGWDATSAAQALSSVETMQMVRNAIKNSDDRSIRKINWQDAWDKGRLVRVVKVTGKWGKHEVVLSLENKKLISATYVEFPQGDLHGISAKEEFSLPAKVYPIYEEVEDEESTGKKTLLPRIESELRYLNRFIHRSSQDPFAALKTQRYQDDKYDPLLGLTVEGRKKGFWAMGFIKDQAQSLVNALPLSENSFQNGGVFLEGRYVTVSLYNEASKLQNLSFTPQYAAHFRPDFRVMPDKPDHEEMLPVGGLYGRPVTSIDDVLNRPARRLADHDPASYVNDGFDELQVYWSVTQMFESLGGMGFNDPELSTRPFKAFLFNPDISYRDNAFYTDDTINFTTYSAKTPNMARDNTTIWHELGHGVMDRLMGDFIQLADTGGLSEGMADFVAQLVLNDVTGGTYFPGKEKMRIFNNTGFSLTNEVHDDGESYGGSMNDLLRAAMAKYGRLGLVKVTDLTMEAMRLTRNHPGLTALDWFQHMLFADELGREGTRAPGELRDIIVTALNGRNFSLDGAAPATYTVKNGAEEVTSTGPGSRNNPIRLKLGPEETATHHMEVSLKNSATYRFKFPVTIKVSLRGGPLQGAVHWNGEEAAPTQYVLNSDADVAKFDLTALGKCDEINRPDGSCQDFAYLQVWNFGETAKPQAKKRFYLRVYPK